MPHPTTNELAGTPLLEIYQRLVAGTVSTDSAVATIEDRGLLAESVLTLQAAALSQMELDDAFERLQGALAPSNHGDQARDAYEREIARVQLNAIELERTRRADLMAARDMNEVFLPKRDDMIAAEMEAMLGLERGDPNARYRSTYDEIVAIARKARGQVDPGIPYLTHVLRLADQLPDEPNDPDPIDRWVRTALAVSLLSEPMTDVRGTPFTTDPATRAEANRAKRLFYATDRQDPRYQASDWRLDLLGPEISNLLEHAYITSTAWENLGLSQDELSAYLTPSRREEQGRPDPHPQVVSEKEARAMAEAAGGIKVPLVFTTNIDRRAEHARQIWEHGLPPVSSESLGLVLYSGGGEPRFDWGAPASSYGIGCALTVPDARILRVHHRDYPLQEDLFKRFQAEAGATSGSSQEYTRNLRKLLLDAGYVVLARFDYLSQTTDVPQEIALLDSSEENVRIIREMVPPFVRGDRPLIVPRDGQEVPAQNGAGEKPRARSMRRG